jgi:hypothetical protein
MRITPRVRRAAAAGVLAAGLGITADRALTQPPAAPAAEPTLVPPTTKDYGARPVAYIYGNVPVTRADLAEFLIARGGYEKVELLVNKVIIEEEARKRNIQVSPQAMEAAFAEDLKGINVKKEDFVNVVLPKYGKTLYEWMEDVVRPRLLLTAMCKDKVQVTDDDLRIEFERQHGEKRAVRIIIWPPSDEEREIFKLWDTIRKSDEEFLRLARQQANPALAAAAGEIKPINRHLVAEDKIVETTAFGLREGEVSQVLKTRQGYMVMKLLKVIPPDATAKFEDEKVREALHKEMFEQKLTAEIPKQFAELAKAANPTILLKGPPSHWQFAQTTRQTVEEFQRQQETLKPGAAVPAGGQVPKK